MTQQVSAAELALRLHAKRTSTLALELEDGEQISPAEVRGCYRTEGRMVEFESLEVRNTLVAQERFDAFDKNWNEDAGPLLDAAFALWRKEIGHADKASGRLTALAADQVDVVLAAARAMRAGRNVFDQLHVLEAALPYLRTLDVNSLLELFEAKYEATRHDMAGWMFHAALEQWLAKRPETSKAVHDLALLSAIPAHQSLICNAIVALSKTDFAAAVELAMDDAKRVHADVAETGVWALGRLLLESKDKDLTDKLERSIAGYLASPEHPVRRGALHAACGALHQTRVFDREVMALAHAGDQHALSAIADALFRHWKDIREQTDLNEWLVTLALLDVSKGSAMTVDGVFSELVEAPEHGEAVIRTLHAWVARQPRSTWHDTQLAESFPSTMATLRGAPDLWRRFLTTWLLSTSKAHPAAIAGLISLTDEGALYRFDTAIIDELDAAGLGFLARRMLGFIIGADVLLSLTYSMLGSKEAPARVYPVARHLIIHEIGYDYPNTTMTSLEGRITEAQGEEKVFLEETLAALKGIVDNEHALPRLKELRPSAQLGRLYARARAEQMSSAFREASKGSILHVMANKITVKAGSGAFSHRDGGYDEAFKMGSISHSIEVPRREVLDPIGNAIRMLHLRSTSSTTREEQ